MTNINDAHEYSAISERAPTLGHERLFNTYGSFFYTLIALATAIWVVLVGGAIPAVGDTKLGLLGFACGTILGTVLIIVSAGFPSLRYGVDTIHICKSALGVRGSGLALLGLVVMGIGWAGVALALVARGLGSLLGNLSHHFNTAISNVEVYAGLLLLALFYLLVRHGLSAIKRVNQFAGPALLVLSCGSFALLLYRYGLDGLLTLNVPTEQALTNDRQKAFAYALEFGVTMTFGWWPNLGTLFRFVRYRHHAVGPMMIGGSLVGTLLSASVAALAAVHLGSPDPIVWLVALTGPFIGPILVAFVLLLSVPAICLLVYFTATAALQLPLLTRSTWNTRVILTIAPLALVPFNTDWTITHVVTVGTFGSLIFFSISGIVFVDFWILRRGKIELAHLFVENRRGRYWYTGGINLAAVITIILGCAAYLYLFDPITLEARYSFRYAGASLPVFIGSALLYFLLMRLSTITRADRSTKPTLEDTETIEVGL